MANHCYNYAVFNGELTGLKQLVNSLEKTKKESDHESYAGGVTIYGSNGHLLLGTKPPEVNENGILSIDPYDEYGSKWFECNWEVEERDGIILSVTLQGDSAWSPVLPLFEKICRRMKLSCHGNYEESGMDFAGDFEINAEGDVMEDQMTYRQYQAINNPNWFWENLIENIREGYFETFESVYSELAECKWQVSESERKELQEVYDAWKNSNNDED